MNFRNHINSWVNRMIYLYAVPISGIEYNIEIYSFIHILSEERRDKIAKYINKVDQMRSILGEALLQYILWKHYHIYLNEIHFKYNAYGKPSLVDIKGIYFNISHSGDWILCGVSDSPIGIDVEGRATEFMPIAKRFFTKDEYTYIKCQLPINQYDVFCKIWTLKESYIKCVGEGLSIPLDSFCFDFSDNHIRMYNYGILNTDYLFLSKKINNQYYMALCVRDTECNIWCDDMNIIDVKDLLIWRDQLLI